MMSQFIRRLSSAAAALNNSSSSWKRTPMIQFRHLKGELAKNSSMMTKSTTTGSSSPQVIETKSSATTTQDKKKAIDFLELPPYFGRLPPLTAKEIALLHSGGAYSA
jgi:Ribosomal protein S36, mitochondrial